jgi:AcrR family transcriptional regulator
MELFWRRGYEGVSIRELTDAMGVNPPSLYAAFGSKQQLFRDAVALYDEMEGSATDRALRAEPTARAAIEAMLRDNVDVYADPDKPSGCLIVLGATTSTRANRPIREHLAALRLETERLIRARLERAAADGEIAAETNVEAIASYYNTVLEGLSIQARDGSTAHTMHAIIDCAMAAWEPLTARRAGRRPRR